MAGIRTNAAAEAEGLRNEALEAATAKALAEAKVEGSADAG